MRCIREAHQFYGLNQSAMLDRLGFSWDAQEDNRESRFNTDIELLRVFKRSFGHLDIPIEFIVPSTSDWPEQAWGSPLGSKAMRIKTGLLYAEPLLQGRLKQLGNGVADIAR